MPKSDDRFYLMQLSNRPAMHGDIGSLVRLEGVIIGGGGESAVLLLPGGGSNGSGQKLWMYHTLDIEAWSDWLQRSDAPEILVGPSLTGTQGATLPKIWHRKLRYEISGAVQQKIWSADGFKCVYCGQPMGKVLMTIDHFVPLENGGKNDVTNYLSSCKPCNKDKGSEDPVTWCARRGRNYSAIASYLADRKVA